MGTMMTQTYPVILHPAPGTEMVKPMRVRGGKKKKKGASELVAMARVFRYGFKGICEDVCMSLEGHRYEPDLAYISDNVCVDIEIDEPYSGSGHPTHFVNEDGTNVDTKRNQHFHEAGWHVIRFSEEQIFCHTKECMKEVFKLLQDAGAINELPAKLVGVPDLKTVSRWTFEDSKRLKRKNFRRSYLGFNPARNDFRGTIRCITLLLPIIWQSIWDRRVRKEMFAQLGTYVKLLMR